MRKMRMGNLTSILLVFLAGCICRAPVPKGTGTIQTRGSITLYRHPLELCLSKPNGLLNRNELVVYATGDGGWRGLDETHDIPGPYLVSKKANLGRVGPSDRPIAKPLGLSMPTLMKRRRIRAGVEARRMRCPYKAREKSNARRK
jgi:hypothetical protein